MIRRRPVGRHEAEPAPLVSRNRLLIAAAVTVIAVPLLVFRDVTSDDGTTAVTTTTAPLVRAPGPTTTRPASGLPKGASVSTSSTTSSTLPLVTTTTTVPGQIRAEPTDSTAP